MPNILDELSIKLSAQTSTVESALSNVAASIGSIVQELGELKAVKVPVMIPKKTSDSLRDFADAVNRLDLSRLAGFTNAMISLSSIGSFNMGLGGRTAENLTNFSAALNQIDVNKLYLMGQAISAADFSNLKILGETARDLTKLYEQYNLLYQNQKKVAEAQSKITINLNETRKEAQKTARTVHHTTGIFGKFFQSIKRIAFYRAIRSAMREFTQGFSEGIENLYYWSQTVGSSFAPSMDRLATATQYLKNGFASMWSPLIERAIPVIDALIDKFVDFFNFVQEGFAQLTGAETWNRALKYPVAYADALDDASASAKAFKNQLMGFDELNVINTPTDRGRSGDKDAKDYSSMFELVKTATGNNFEGIGERLANAINKVFDEPDKWKEWGTKIADWICNAFDQTLEFFKNVNWQNVGASITGFATKFITRIAEKIRDTDWGQVTVEITNALCGIIEGTDSDLVDSLIKLFASLMTAIPSIVIASIENTLRITAAILKKLGFDKASAKLGDWADNAAKLRQNYEKLRGTVLDATWNLLDYGQLFPDTTRGFEYDPTQDQGRSFGFAGAVVGDIESDDGTDLQINVDTYMNGAKTVADKIKEKLTALGLAIMSLPGHAETNIKTKIEDAKTKISTWWTNFKTLWSKTVGIAAIKSKIEAIGTKISTWWGNFKTLWSKTVGIAAVKSKIEAIGTKISTWWSNFKKGWGTRTATVTTKLAAVGTKVSTWWSNFKTLWSKTVGIASVKSKIEAVGSKISTWWSGFKKNWGTRTALVKSKIESIGTKISVWWTGFKKSWGTRTATVKSKIEAVGTKISVWWSGFKTSWGTRTAEVKSRIESFKGKISSAWSTFKENWGTRYADAKSRITRVGTAISEGWKAFKDEWNKTDKNASIAAKITGMLGAISVGWSTFTQNWKDKKAEISTFVTNIRDSIDRGWQDFKDKWATWRSVPVETFFTRLRDTVNEAWQTIQNLWNGSSRQLSATVTAKANQGSGASFARGGFFASGGFPAPSSGSLFWAGEGGVPEILGTIGGRNAVAGGAEITGIRQEIANQGAAERQLLAQLIAAVNSKDLSLVANSSTGRWVSKALKSYQGVTG